VRGGDARGVVHTASRRRREPSFRPIVLIENATFAQYAAVKARSLELPGIIEQEVPARHYPANATAAHLFGYVGEISETQLQRSEYEGVDPGALVGQAGVEVGYNKQLMGVDGGKTVVVNSVGREIRELTGESKPPVIGRPMQLTIDASIQKAIEDGVTGAGFNRP